MITEKLKYLSSRYLGDPSRAYREINEDVSYTAERELFEEIGAEKFKITYINDYSLNNNKVIIIYKHVYLKRY